MGLRSTDESGALTPQEAELRRERDELRRVVRAYDAVTNALPSWLKCVIVDAHPPAYNGAPWTPEDLDRRIWEAYRGRA